MNSPDKGGLHFPNPIVVARQQPVQLVADSDSEEAGVVLCQQPVQLALESDNEEAGEDVVPEAGIQPGPSEPPEAPISEDDEEEESLLDARARRAAKRQEWLLWRRSPRE